MTEAAASTWTFDHVVSVVGLILIPLAATVIPLWISRARRRDARQKEETRRLVEEATAKARHEGAEAAMAEAQRKATEALHARLTRYGRRLVKLEQDREFLLKKGVIPAGSQVGEDGRGAHNPMLDPDEDG